MNGEDKRYFEDLINNSAFFDLNEGEDSVRRAVERNKLIENIYSYCVAINEENAELTLEIFTQAQKCISSYDKSKGVFLHYFNTSFKKLRGTVKRDKTTDETIHGMKLSEKNRRVIAKYKKVRAGISENYNEDKLNELIADIMGVPVEKISEITILLDRKVESNYFVNSEDGEESDIFDYVEDKKADFADAYEQLKIVKERLVQIEKAFNALQQRQKPLLAKFLTNEITNEFTDNALICDCIKTLAFFDKEIFDGVLKNKGKYADKDIAKMLGILPQSYSRSVNKFKEKLVEIK